MLDPIKRFVLDESGLETIEWAIVGGVITAAGIALFFAIGMDANRGMTSFGIEVSLIP